MTSSLSNGTTERKPDGWRRSIARLGIVALVTVGLTVPLTAHAATAWVWRVTAAELTLESDYQTVDPWSLRDAQEQLTADLRAGYPESSTQVRHDRQDVAAAKRAGYASRAWCRGIGSSGGGYYGRFWCRVRVKSDLTEYQATRKLTVIVRGRDAFVTRPGWH